MKTAIYVRVSTNNKGQDTDNQLMILRQYCTDMNYQVYDEYVDEVSGGTSDRPSFKRMFTDASKHKFDMVLFWSLDRFSREGTRTTIHLLEQLEQYGICFRSYTEQYIDSSGIFKDVIISLLSTLAKQEKLRQSERVIAGLKRSREKYGRIGGRPKISENVFEDIIKLKKDGVTNRQIGKKLGISHVTVANYLQKE